MPRYRRRFNQGPRRVAKPPVIVHVVIRKKPGACAGCGLPIATGETYHQLRIQRRFSPPCAACSTLPKVFKNFHVACTPADVNVAMNFDPSKSYMPPVGGAVPPPVNPLTFEDAALAALASLENALMIKARVRGVTPEMEKEFKTFQMIKARVLRPGTVAEGEVAVNIALQRLVKLVFAS